VSLFAPNAVPATDSNPDNLAVQLGTKFVPAKSGQVVGVRFYKGTTNTGTHTGSLWSASGTRLAEATFGTESAGGWQSAYFATPVSVTAGTTYVISYQAPNGNYSSTGAFFSAPYVNGDLSAPATSNGVYAYGNDLFPSNSYNATNYWVDPLVVFDTTTPTPTPTPTPTATYTTLFPDTATPANPDWNDPASIEVGVTFSSTIAGKINGVRFYKGATNIGTHVGSLWSSTGTLLASGTFTSETATGWQTLLFTTPVAITAGTTYVASYRAPNGQYSADLNAFSAALTASTLQVPASGANYTYGSGFPNNSSPHNYWVDVLFSP